MSLLVRNGTVVMPDRTFAPMYWYKARRFGRCGRAFRKRLRIP